MTTHNRIADLTLQLSGRLVRLSRGATARSEPEHRLASAPSNPQSERLHPAARQFERLRQLTIRWRDDTPRVRYCTRS